MNVQTPPTFCVLFAAAVVNAADDEPRETPPIPLVTILPPDALEDDEDDSSPTRPMVRRGDTWAEVVSTCTKCGERYDEEGWQALERRGLQPGGPHGVYELRNCPCTSTLAVCVAPPCSDYASLPKTDAPPAL